MTPSREIVCPQCRGSLVAVRQPASSPLNRDQWDAQKAGDYYCRSCPDNGRGATPLCYWNHNELPFVHDYQI